jgi:hypothetical protein
MTDDRILGHLAQRFAVSEENLTTEALTWLLRSARVTRSADEVDKACQTKDPDSGETREPTRADAPDPGEIRRATVGLSVLTAKAVEVVYPKRGRDGTAADGPRTAPGSDCRYQGNGETDI